MTIIEGFMHENAVLLVFSAFLFHFKLPSFAGQDL